MDVIYRGKIVCWGAREGFTRKEWVVAGLWLFDEGVLSAGGSVATRRWWSWLW